MKRKFLAILLSVIILVGMMPVSAMATDILASGKCGDNLSWELDKNGKLTISGNGDMYDYEFKEVDISPWDEYSEEIITIIIENGVTSIGDWAFKFCDKLNEVTIANSVTRIGKSAFWYAENLESLIIPNGVKIIEEGAFGYCSSLWSMNIPASVKTLEGNAFQYCTALKSIYVDEDNLNYSNDGRGVLFNKDKTELIAAPLMITGYYIIPDSVVTIREEAFANCYGLKGVTIPDGVKIICDEAFDDCYEINRFDIPASVSIIGYGAFGVSYGELTGIYVDKNNENYSSDDNGVLFNKEKTELIQVPCKMTGKYEIPYGVITIGDYAFQYCEVSEIIIPNGVVNFGIGAFFACQNLKSIELPSGFTEISNEMLAYCRNLTSIIIPDGVTFIDYRAFSDCESLREVTIPISVKEIEESAFGGCDNLIVSNYKGSVDNWNEINIDYGNEYLTKVVHFNIQGDVDGNGELSNTDLVMVARYIVELYDENTVADIEAYGDMNGDGEVTNTDLIIMARKIVGLD